MVIQKTERFEIAEATCEQFSDLHICGFAKKAHQGWDAPAVLQCDLVIVVGFAVHQVPQSTTSAAVHITHPVIQQVYQELDAPLSSYLQQTAQRYKLAITTVFVPYHLSI